ncbi:MAG: hypothetical protein Q8R55_07050 [Candidatus Taylorbacteria bacterium]|nr:hypothetical protein [Candidatus Taylorbacteria bacterium]
MKKLLLVFLITFVLIGVVDAFNPVEKARDVLSDHEIEVINGEPEPKLVEIVLFKNILEKVEDGKKLLADSPPLAIVERGVKKKEIAIAILDAKTGEVFERRYWIENQDIQKANEFRTNTCGREDHFPYLLPISNRPDFFVVVNWWNSYNSNLSIVDSGCDEGDRYIVVANKILISNERLVYPQDRTGKKYSDIVYSPYSEQLHREEIIQEGLNFLNENVTKAFSGLETLKVRSRAIPGKMVTETMTPAFVKNLFINEQSDPGSMLNSDDGGRRIAERVLIRLGLNKDLAFRYTYSSVGALGLGQIMPQTYKNIVHDYPEVSLIKDVGVGRTDVLNAIKASILVLDDHFAAVVNRANQSNQGKKMLSRKTEKEIEDIRAAIYNGGPGKYQSLTGNISLAISETVSFLMKLSLIRELHLFD